MRVCGDPDNLPYSNERLEGFENRIAAVVAAELGDDARRMPGGLTSGASSGTPSTPGTCDVIFGVPEGLDFVLWTKPYYRSSYVMAYRSDRGYDFRSLDAPALQQLRIGVHVNTPPEESLARRGLLDNVSTYSLFFDPRGDRDRPRKLLDDLVAGTVDVAVAWGPLAGYAATDVGTRPSIWFALADEPGVPLSFDISMGVAKGNEELKSRLETAIDRRQSGDSGHSGGVRRPARSYRRRRALPRPLTGGGSGGAPAGGGTGRRELGRGAGADARADARGGCGANEAEPVHRGTLTGPRRAGRCTFRSAVRAATAAGAAAGWRPP